MAAVIRLKRKACDEPAGGLLIAVKKSKHECSDTSEVLFKFAATLNNENESLRDQIQAALAKENSKKFTNWRDPKNVALSKRTVKKLNEKIRTEHKDAVAKKKLDLLNNRRLILSEEFKDLEEGPIKDAEVRQLFHLYDIIEENEDVKKVNDEPENVIMCNDTPLVREKVEDYVFDVYIADREIDQTFVDRTVSQTWISQIPADRQTASRKRGLENDVFIGGFRQRDSKAIQDKQVFEINRDQPIQDDIYFGNSDDSEDCREDDDDSNDENNWRNEYPDDADSPLEKGTDSDSDNSGGSDDDDQREMRNAFNHFVVDDFDDSRDDEDCDDLERNSFDYSRVMRDLTEEYSED